MNREQLIKALREQWNALDPVDPFRDDIAAAADMLEADGAQQTDTWADDGGWTFPIERPMNPDWSQLEATQESLREHMAMVKELQAKLSQQGEQQPTFAAELQALKAHIKEKKDDWIDHNSWNGDTESGFYTTEEVDMEALFSAIDEFGASLRNNAGAAPAAQARVKALAEVTDLLREYDMIGSNFSMDVAELRWKP